MYLKLRDNAARVDGQVHSLFAIHRRGGGARGLRHPARLRKAHGRKYNRLQRQHHPALLPTSPLWLGREGGPVRARLPPRCGCGAQFSLPEETESRDEWGRCGQPASKRAVPGGPSREVERGGKQSGAGSIVIRSDGQGHSTTTACNFPTQRSYLHTLCIRKQYSQQSTGP